MIAPPGWGSDTSSRWTSGPATPACCSRRRRSARGRCITRAGSTSMARHSGCRSPSIPGSRSLVYKVDPETLKATLVFRVADHIGAFVRDPERVRCTASAGARGASIAGRCTRTARSSRRRPGIRRTSNPSHYVDYQDCKYAGPHAMVCGGVSHLRRAPGSAPIRLGGSSSSISTAAGRIQVPVPLWTSSGQAMTRNPIWIEPAGPVLRAWFMPEDDVSALIYEVR